MKRSTPCTTPKPKYIYKYRNGKKFLYLAFWSGAYDEMSRSEVLYWKRRGVKIKDGNAKPLN